MSLRKLVNISGLNWEDGSVHKATVGIKRKSLVLRAPDPSVTL